MRSTRQFPAAILLTVALSAVALVPAAEPAAASTGQLAMFQPGPRLLTDPVGTLTRLRTLGVGVVRVIVNWSSIAPKPTSRARIPGFNGANPNAYPAASWAPYDAVVREGQALGLRIDLTVGGGAPLWADGPGVPAAQAKPQYAWKPNTADFGAFVRAIGARYSGSFRPPGSSRPLPRVGFWAIWNEPNFGKNLAPQATNGSSVAAAPGMYRTLIDVGWRSLQATGHGHDTILIGSLAARGVTARPHRGAPQGLPGNFGETKPLQFTRSLYCVDSSNRPLRGGTARAIGCPTNAAGSRGFRRAHPGLFSATGFADHPYPLNLPPTKASSRDPDYTEFSQVPRLESQLDLLQRIYGSRKRFPVYITEYGYITNPPNRGRYVSPATAAVYINWAEYISWRSPRLATTMQYPLFDPDPKKQPEFGGFASGLIFFNGKLKPGYDAYRLPLFLPLSKTPKGRALEVWGCARPAHFASGTQRVTIQFQRGSRGAFTTLSTVAIRSARGYFDVHLKFPASGSVRLQWTYADGTVAHSRVVKVTVS
jgi:hypothetical protein